jgi:hypothetical protein
LVAEEIERQALAVIVHEIARENPGQGVLARSAEHSLRTLVRRPAGRVYLIVAGTGDDHIATAAALNEVASAPARDPVIALGAVECVHSPIPREPIVARAPARALNVAD